MATSGRSRRSCAAIGPSLSATATGSVYPSTAPRTCCSSPSRALGWPCAGAARSASRAPWLYRIVHNAAANAHRSARLRRHEPIESASPVVAAGDVETAVLARDTLRHLAALPQMQQRAVVMTAIEGRSHEEAAGVLGVSDGAVRGLVHRARTTLRAAAAALSPQGLLGLLSRAAGDGSIAERPVEAGAAGGGPGRAALQRRCGDGRDRAARGRRGGPARAPPTRGGHGAPRDGRGRDGNVRDRRRRRVRRRRRSP